MHLTKVRLLFTTTYSASFGEILIRSLVAISSPACLLGDNQLEVIIPGVSSQG